MMIEKKSRACKSRSPKTANETFWIYMKVVWVKLERDKKVKRSFFSKKMGEFRFFSGGGARWVERLRN